MAYQPYFSHILMLHDICQENPKVYGPFLWITILCLNATAPL